MTTKLQPQQEDVDRLLPLREAEEVDVIRCRDCGETYPAVDGPAVLYSLKSPCMHCGGECELAVIEAPLSQVA